MTQMAQNHQTNQSNKGSNSSGGRKGRGRGGGGAGHGNDAQKKQRVTFPWINDQIITAANTGNLHHLVNTVTVYLPQMNLVNLSTALHRLAKLVGGDWKSQAYLRQTLLPALLSSVHQALARSQVSGALPKCQALSNITWALATMQVVDLPLLQTVVAFAHVQISSFKNFELCQMLWAFAKLGTSNGPLCACTNPLFTAAGEYVLQHIDKFTFRGLVMTSWAFATARLHDSRLFRAIADQLLLELHSANCQELANTAWSFSTAGVHQEHLFEMLAKESVPRFHEFKPQELSSILWSFAAIGSQHDDFYLAAGYAALGMQLQAQQLANILWALTKMRPRHSSTQEVLLQLLPRCTSLIHTFKPQELASVALAAGKSFGNVDSEHPQQLPVQVINFFHAALPLAVPTLREYSGQSLANLTSSLLAVQLGADSGLFDEVSCEILRRTESFENSALLLLVKSLPQAPRSTAVHSAICFLFNEAARRVERMPAREVQVLHRICGKLRGIDDVSSSTLPSREELRFCCLSLASTGAFVPSSTLSDNVEEAQVNADAAATVDEAGDVFAEENIDGDLGETAGDKWAAGITIEVAANTGQTSAWDEEATEQLRHAAETAGARREELARERGSTDGHVDGPAWVADASSGEQASQMPHYVVSVKNTFLDLEPDADADAADEPAIPLPPALPFLPDSVSAEKLAAYRTSYARFRVGNAIGAKGELDKTVS
jgi:hypothetical protein